MTDDAYVAKPPSRLKWVILGCGGGCLGIVLLFVLFFGGIFGGVWALTEAPAVAARAHVEGVRKGDVVSVYAACSKPFRERTSEDEFRRFTEEHPGLYQATDLTLPSRNVNGEGAGLEGTATGPGGTVPVAFRLVKDGDAWKVDGVGTGADGVGSYAGGTPGP